MQEAGDKIQLTSASGYFRQSENLGNSFTYFKMKLQGV